jgi:hypothetical protein
LYTLRCTQRLLRRLPLAVTKRRIAPTTRLGDWYANLLFLRKQHLILCTSERALLSVIVPAKDLDMLPVRVRNAVHSLFQALSLPAQAVAEELEQMSQLIVGKTANRSVLGTMNDIVNHCRWHSANRARLDLRRLELELAGMPAEPLEYAFPRDQAARLFGAA